MGCFGRNGEGRKGEGKCREEKRKERPESKKKRKLEMNNVQLLATNKLLSIFLMVS
jgi:hypothetical protein